jgi:hypothetical protein
MQVVTFFLWAAARFLLYSSFFTIVGSLFTHKSFGRIVAIISAVAGLLGLLQLPITDAVVNHLHRNFISTQIGSGVLVLILYLPAIAMYRWERMD